MRHSRPALQVGWGIRIFHEYLIRIFHESTNVFPGYRFGIYPVVYGLEFESGSRGPDEVL